MDRLVWERPLVANLERLVQDCHQVANLDREFWEYPLVAILDKLA